MLSNQFFYFYYNMFILGNAQRCWYNVNYESSIGSSQVPGNNGRIWERICSYGHKRGKNFTVFFLIQGSEIYFFIKLFELDFVITNFFKCIFIQFNLILGIDGHCNWWRSWWKWRRIRNWRHCTASEFLKQFWFWISTFS